MTDAALQNLERELARLKDEDSELNRRIVERMQRGNITREQAINAELCQARFDYLQSQRKRGIQPLPLVSQPPAAVCQLCLTNPATIHATRLVNGAELQLNVCEPCVAARLVGDASLVKAALPPSK